MDEPAKTAESSFFSELVGEGKKYKTVEDLAKAKVNADQFIAHLERQTNELREDLEKSMTIEAFMKTKAQDDTQTADDAVDPNAGGPSGETTPEPVKQEGSIDKSDLIEQIKAELRKEQEQTQAQSNISSVEQRLMEIHGDEEAVNKAINEKAAELGVSVKWLQDTASTSPTGFYSLMGITKDTPKVAKTLNPALKSEGAPAAESVTPQPGTKAYYDEIRKTDKRRYFSREMQLEMYKASMTDPDKFFAKQS